MDKIEKEEQVEIVKEAIKEWLDEKASEFGKWTVKYLATLIFGAIVYWLAKNGFF